MRAVPRVASDFIKSREHCLLRVYDDKQPSKILMPGDPVEGVLTAGYGHTEGLIAGMYITQSMADRWLADDLIHDAAAPLCGKIGDDIAQLLTENQYSALLSFVFNLGVGSSTKPEWTIWKRLRAKQFDQVPLEMAKFVNWDGQKSEGLVARRAAEVKLWSTDEPGSQPVTPPSTVTRREATPPTPSDPVPASKSGTVIASAATAAAAVPVAIQQAIAIVQPYAEQSHIAAKIVVGLALASALLAVVVVVLTMLKKREGRA